MTTPTRHASARGGAAGGAAAGAAAERRWRSKARAHTQHCTTKANPAASHVVNPLAYDAAAAASATPPHSGGFAPVASELFYVNTGLLDGLTPYPNDPRKTAYTKLSRPIWPRVADPHSIGSKDVAWEEEVEELADAVARL